MAAIRGSRVKRHELFEADLGRLEERYPEIDSVITEYEEALKLDYELPHIAVDPDNLPNVYTQNVDYPPHGSKGLGAFRIILHATDPKPDMRTPYRVFTLLTISER